MSVAKFLLISAGPGLAMRNKLQGLDHTKCQMLQWWPVSSGLPGSSGLWKGAVNYWVCRTKPDIWECLLSPTGINTITLSNTNDDEIGFIKISDLARLGNPRPGELLWMHSKESSVKREDSSGSVMNGKRQERCSWRSTLPASAQVSACSDMQQCCYLEALEHKHMVFTAGNQMKCDRQSIKFKQT